MNEWSNFALLTLLLKSIFIGFSLWTFVWIFSHSRRTTTKTLLDDLDTSNSGLDPIRATPSPVAQAIDQTSCGLIILLGLSEIVVGGLAMPTYNEGLQTPFEYFRFIVFTIVPQLLWLSAIRRNRWIRACFACVFLFIGLIERVLIIVTSFHRDYGMRGEIIGAFASGLVSDLFVYAILVAIGFGLTKLIGKLPLFQRK
ncbi:MAG: hypothetical protein JNK18_10370 [Cyclobacteriaceae bacterium]|nr:hypothetical protein [Cyclobacteriaceae bacterium]